MKNRNFFADWHANHGREYPWRVSGIEPFHTLITEMLLRQTRAGGVALIWPDLIKKYGSPNALIEESSEALITFLKPLGFGVQKTDSLKLASSWILAKESGKVPSIRERLLRIPHVGQYVANATLSFAFGKRIEIVDTNVLRLFSRYFGLKLKPDIRRAPEAWKIARKLLPRSKGTVRVHNYGILDFTADICKPIGPKCGICPLSRKCSFYRELTYER